VVSEDPMSELYVLNYIPSDVVSEDPMSELYLYIPLRRGF